MTTQIECVWNLKPLVISGNATKGQEEKEDVDTELRINSGHYEPCNVVVCNEHVDALSCCIPCYYI